MNNETLAMVMITAVFSICIGYLVYNIFDLLNDRRKNQSLAIK